MRYEPIFEVMTLGGFLATGYIINENGKWYVCDDEVTSYNIPIKYQIDGSAERRLLAHRLVGYVG